MLTISNQQARQFMLLKHGLIGEYKFIGKQGAFDFIHQAGCIQFDPVDLCGKNAEIILQSRVKNFKKDMLHELLYKDRLLFDYPDKQLSIIPVEYWAYFERIRKTARVKLKGHPEIEEHIANVRRYIEENGAVCSNDLEIEGNTTWWSAINWSSGGKFSRSVLEQMYSSGDLIVHHKKGTRRYYDIAENHIPSDILNAPDPIPDDFSHLKWRVLRRIGAIGLLWNRASDAWLNLHGMTPKVRDKIFESLLDENKITEIAVEGLKHALYIRTEDMSLMNEVLTYPKLKPRCEFIAPLDPIMWDRKLIKALFNFHYAWEIYTPPEKRKYGAYVLPILYGDKFMGRIEAIRDSKNKILVVKNIWYEDDVKQTKILANKISTRINKFAIFNGSNMAWTLY